jgi:glycosyltransferase involved in cell wall biosynthesis
MKILCVSSREGWVDDRIANEFKKYSQHEVSFNDSTADIVWLMAPWVWQSIPKELLLNKKVACTIHHQVPEKFDEQNFKNRDKYVDRYHVPCVKTKDFIQKFTNKPIKVIGYWYNQDTWKALDKDLLREKYKEHFSPQDFVIGSFQRDSEGANPNNPKLEKGPDLFFDYVSSFNRDTVHVLLAGWRRTYLINRLKKANIPYTYFELVDTEKLNELYSVCDLYAVMSRQEGGPQALFEAPACGTAIISTDVGMAREALPEQCIVNAKDPAAPMQVSLKQTQDKMKKFEIKNHIKNYDNFFSSL